MNHFFDYDTAKAVYYVYLYGGISRAGDKINLTQSAMSRRIQMAEERSGIMIFERGFHELTPTKEGLTYIEACKKILHIGDAALKDAHAIAKSEKDKIRILSTPSLANTLIPALLEGYDELCPGTTVNIRSTVQPLDILDADVVIGYYLPDNEDVEQYRLFDQIQSMYASQAYLDKFGVPNSIEDLDRHRLLVIDPATYIHYRNVNWILTLGLANERQLRPAYMEFSTNDSKMRAMQMGYGIGTASEMHIKLIGADNLVPVLPEIERNEQGVYFITNSLAKKQSRIEKMRSLFVENLKKYM